MTTYPFPNPISDAIEALDAKLATLDKTTLDKLEGAATLEPDLFLATAEIPSLLTSALGLDATVILHAIHTEFAERTLAERIVFLQVAKEYMDAKRSVRV